MVNLKKKKINLIKILFLFFLIISKTNQSLSIENKIILKVDNQIITSLDVEKEKIYLETLNPEILNLSSEEIYNIAKNSLVREKIKKKEIIKIYNKIEVEEEILESVLKSMYAGLNIASKQEFINYVNNKKLNYENIVDKISVEILWNRLIYLKYNKKININTEEIKNQLNNEKKKLKQYLLQEILFELKKDEELKTRYENISTDIEKNGFEKVALTQSISDSSKNGGLIGWVNESSLNKNILSKINKIDIGNFTKPIIIPGGFLILKIKDVKIIKKEINIDQELEKIVKEKRNQQLNQYSIIFYNKIKKDITIK